MKCDICSQDLDQGAGFLLTTEQVVSNSLYWKRVFENSLFSAFGGQSDQMKASFASRMAAQKSPWLICEDCIALFASRVDRHEARQFALTFHQSGGTFAPPGSGPVPLSKVDMGDGKVYIQGGSPEALEISRRLAASTRKGNPSCFIATAAFSASAPEVETLRRLRDRVLLRHPMGRRFVAYYYRTSPQLAAWVAFSPRRRKVVRWALYPIVGVVQLFSAVRCK